MNSFGDTEDDMEGFGFVRNWFFKQVDDISFNKWKLCFKTWMQAKRQKNLTFNP
jgi:hypothetical protein